MKHPERIEQMKLVALVREFHPDLLFWHTPSGEERCKKIAFNLRQMGTRPGVPDLFFPTLRWFLELKAPGVYKAPVDGLKPKQVEVIGQLVLFGYAVSVHTDARTAFDEVERRVRQSSAGTGAPDPARAGVALRG